MHESPTAWFNFAAKLWELFRGKRVDCHVEVALHRNDGGYPSLSLSVVNTGGVPFSIVRVEKLLSTRQGWPYGQESQQRVVWTTREASVWEPISPGGPFTIEFEDAEKYWIGHSFRIICKPDRVKDVFAPAELQAAQRWAQAFALRVREAVPTGWTSEFCLRNHPKVIIRDNKGNHVELSAMSPAISNRGPYQGGGGDPMAIKIMISDKLTSIISYSESDPDWFVWSEETVRLAASGALP